MILTRTHTSIPPVPSEPSVGGKAVTRHLRDNSSRIRCFLTSLEPTVRETMPELGLGDAPVRLSLVVENNRISLVPTVDVTKIVADDYMFSCSLVDGTKRADVGKAMANGALPFLASIRVQVRHVNKMSEQSHPATLFELSSVLARIDRDATAIVRIIQEQRGEVATGSGSSDLRPRETFVGQNGSAFVSI